MKAASRLQTLLLVLALAACERHQANPSGAEASASNASAPVRAPPSGSPSTPAPNALLSAAEPKSVRIARGARLVREFECARCHAGSGAPTPPLHKQCVGCHQSILGGDYAITDSATGQRREASKADLREWQAHIVHLRHVPDLGQLGQTLREDWLARYLLNPQDLRPALPASMPRFALSAQQAQDIAAYLTRDAIPSGNTRAPTGGASKQEIADGRRLFGSAGCAGCHALTGADVSPPKAVRDPRFLAPEALLAPDLRFARERFLAGKFEEWLSQPRQLRSAALMPPHRVSAEDARKLRAFVWSSPLRATPVAALPAALPLLTRPVTFDEVNREVFRKVCWHCHSQPDFARGDGGPGMTGGFGFKGRKLDLSQYSALLGGYLDDRGERRSLFTPAPSGEAMLLAVLTARQLEEVGRPATVRGMPLGLPALSPEQIQLVASWIEQGRPR